MCAKLGEVRLVSKNIVAQHSYRKMEVGLETPNACQCGFKNFYVWGTRINGKTHVEIRCMCCGKKNWDVTL